MNWTDEELDQLFSDAANNATVEYNDAYWKDIEGMLPVRKKRKGLLWWMGSAGALVFFGSLLLVQVPFTNKSTFANQAVRELSNESAKQSNERLSSTVSVKENKAESTAENQQTGFNNIPIQKTNAAEVNNLPKVNQSNGNMAVKTTDESKMKSQLVQPNAQSLNPIADNSGKLIEKESPFEVQDDKLVTEVNEENISTLPLIDLYGFHQLPELISTSYKLKTRSPHALYVEVGVGMGQSPILSSENGSGMAKNYGLQFGYSHQKSKFRFSSGLGISLQQFNNVYIKERSLIYGYGVNSVDNHYRFSSLLRFEVPLSISYQMNRHILSAGMSLSFPIVSGVSYTKFIDGNISIQEKGYTSTEFFKPFGTEAQIGYAYQIGSNWEIGIKVQMQLINPIDSERIIGKTNALPLSGQMTLRKTIVFKK